MRKIICSVQAGKLDRDLIPSLEAALKRIYREQFDAAHRVVVLWCEVPQGQGFTEGRLSDVSWVMVEVDDGLDQAAREKAMQAMANEWARIARVSTEKLMITLSDSSVFNQYLAANRRRIRPLRRPGFVLATLLRLWHTRRRDGYASINANF